MTITTTCYVKKKKNTNHWIALIRTQINGLEQKKIQDANNARKKHIYVENSRIRGKKDLNRLLYERFHGLKDRSKRKNIECNIDESYLHELWER